MGHIARHCTQPDTVKGAGKGNFFVYVDLGKGHDWFNGVVWDSISEDAKNFFLENPFLRDPGQRRR